MSPLFLGNPFSAQETRVFIDLQIALFLGIKSGMRLRFQYKDLNSRIATPAEKEKLEHSVVSQKLLESMLNTVDRTYIKTTVHDGVEYLKLADLDIHIIYWDATLHNILQTHFEKIEIEGQALRIQDFDWPETDIDVGKDTRETGPKNYVHKLKRFRLG